MAPIQVLRMVFAHYATLDVASTHLCDWIHVETVNRTMSRDEFIKFLMNFDVVPCLLARNDVDGLMEQVGLAPCKIPSQVSLYKRETAHSHSNC